MTNLCSPSTMCGPFCSVPAVPTITVVHPALTRSRVSAQVSSSRKTVSGGVPPGPVAGASAGRWAARLSPETSRPQASGSSRWFMRNSLAATAYTGAGGPADHCPPAGIAWRVSSVVSREDRPNGSARPGNGDRADSQTVGGRLACELLNSSTEANAPAPDTTGGAGRSPEDAMGPLSALLASDHRQTLEFFFIGLKDVSGDRSGPA